MHAWSQLSLDLIPVPRRSYRLLLPLFQHLRSCIPCGSNALKQINTESPKPSDSPSLEEKSKFRTPRLHISRRSSFSNTIRFVRICSTFQRVHHYLLCPSWTSHTSTNCAAVNSLFGIRTVTTNHFRLSAFTHTPLTDAASCRTSSRGRVTRLPSADAHRAKGRFTSRLLRNSRAAQVSHRHQARSGSSNRRRPHPRQPDIKLLIPYFLQIQRIPHYRNPDHTIF